MDINCPGCGRRYKIADDKLPAGGTAQFVCPNCKDKIIVEAPRKEPDKKAAKKGQQKKKLFHETTVDYIDPDEKAALIYSIDYKAVEQIQKSLKNLGYVVRSVHKQGELATRLQYHLFEILCLYQSGPAPDQEMIRILKYINGLRPEIRRKLFVAYIYTGGNRFETLEAFSWSMDIMLNPLDINHLDEILPRALKEKEQKYKIFYETRDAMEKKSILNL